MAMLVEAVYEHGILKPLEPLNLQEHARYTLVVQEHPAPPVTITDPILTKRIAERTTILRDGSTYVNLLGLFDSDANELSFEAIEAIPDESRADQQREWDELYGPEAEQ